MVGIYAWGSMREKFKNDKYQHQSWMSHKYDYFQFPFQLLLWIHFFHIIRIMAEIWENFAVIQINSKSQNCSAMRYSHRTHIVHYFSLRIRVFLWNVWPFWHTMLAQTNQKFRDKCFPKQCATFFHLVLYTKCPMRNLLVESVKLFFLNLYRIVVVLHLMENGNKFDRASNIRMWWLFLKPLSIRCQFHFTLDKIIQK